jgi:hypothetical protein
MKSLRAARDVAVSMNGGGDGVRCSVRPGLTHAVSCLIDSDSYGHKAPELTRAILKVRTGIQADCVGAVISIQILPSMF